MLALVGLVGVMHLWARRWVMSLGLFYFLGLALNRGALTLSLHHTQLGWGHYAPSEVVSAYVAAPTRYHWVGLSIYLCNATLRAYGVSWVWGWVQLAKVRGWGYPMATGSG